MEVSGYDFCVSRFKSSHRQPPRHPPGWRPFSPLTSPLIEPSHVHEFARATLAREVAASLLTAPESSSRSNSSSRTARPRSASFWVARANVSKACGVSSLAGMLAVLLNFLSIAKVSSFGYSSPSISDARNGPIQSPNLSKAATSTFLNAETSFGERSFQLFLMKGKRFQEVLTERNLASPRRFITSGKNMAGQPSSSIVSSSRSRHMSWTRSS